MSKGWNIDVPSAEAYSHALCRRPWAPLTEEFGNALSAQPIIAIDTETTGLSSWRDLPLGWSVAFENRRAALDISVLPYFRRLTEDPNRVWLLANAKFDMHMLANLGFPLKGHVFDVQVMHALLYPDRPHSLKEVCYHLEGWKWADFQDTFGKITKNNPPALLLAKAFATDPALAVDYMANDAWGTLAIGRKLHEQLTLSRTTTMFSDPRFEPHIENLWDYFSKLEAPYTRVLWHQERRGALLDLERMRTIEPQLKRGIGEKAQEIARLARDAGATYLLEPSKNEHISEYLYSTKKYPIIKYTDGGKSGKRAPSVDESVIERYADRGDPVCLAILEYKKLAKLHSTYFLGIEKFLDPEGRIHTRYNQDVARTGRLSSSDPNTQNIPNAERDKFKVRAGFIAQKGHKLVASDYSQIEMRLLAGATQEDKMIQIFLNKWDIHMGNAAMMLDVPYDDIKAAKEIDKKIKEGLLDISALTAYFQECLDARSAAKTIGFGLVYGMGDNKLAASLKIPLEMAIKRREAFQAAYPAAGAFAEQMHALAERTGCAFTLMGRRRPIPDILSNRRWERLKAQRIAGNTPIQGSAAEILKWAAIRWFHSDIPYQTGAHMNLQVHDELTFEVPEESVKEMMAQTKHLMENPFCEEVMQKLRVPLVVDINSGNNWAEAK